MTAFAAVSVAWLAANTLALAVWLRLARRSTQDGPGLDVATVQAMALTSQEHVRQILATDTTGLPRCYCGGYGIPVGAEMVIVKTPDPEPTAHSLCLCQPVREMVR